MRIVVVMLLALSCTSCATVPPEEQVVWARVDGQRIQGNPALEAQHEVDKVVCDGEMQKANLSGSNYCRGLADCIISGAIRGSNMQTVGKGCMADRGYLLMARSQAEAHIAAASAARSAPPRPNAPATRRSRGKPSS